MSYPQKSPLKFVPDKVWQSFFTALPGTKRTTSWLLKIMIPVSLLVAVMTFFGIIEWIAGYTSPLFNHLGLPGDAAIPFVSGALVGTYGGLAAMPALGLGMREATIVALMICVCHGLPMESTVVSKTGSSFWGMTILRIIMALLCAYVLNLILPEIPGKFNLLSHSAENETFVQMFLSWGISILKMSIMVLIIIYALMFVQKVLEAYDGIRKISSFLGPLMRVFGLPENTAYMWLVANILGISYGSAVMIGLQKNGLMSRQQSNEANYHLVMNHSLFEDTIVFSTAGVSALVVITTRVGLALLVVWSRKSLIKLHALIMHHSVKPAINN